MNNTPSYDAIIIGGSCAGLAAALCLGRARRNVLVIDSGSPCNRQAPHSHNLIMHDGEMPAAIARKARASVAAYPTIHFLNGRAATASGANRAFHIDTEDGRSFTAKKLLLTTGVKDIMPPIPGFAECWGITVLHCPYCHGYEVRDEALGIIANGEIAFQFSRLLYNWSKNLTLFTAGPATIDEEQKAQLSARGIALVEQEIAAIEHSNGNMSSLVLEDDTKHLLKAVFAKIPFEQHSDIAATLGCALAGEGIFAGLIAVDEFAKTSVPGVYAAGDNSHPFRSVAMAIGAGNKAAAMLNHELVQEEF